MNAGQNAHAIAWDEVEEVSTDNWRMNQYSPSVVVDGNIVHVVWSDGELGDYDIMYRQYDGMTWLPTIEISTDTGTEQQFSSRIAVNGPILHVVWADLGDGDSDIYYRQFNGLSWQPEVEISTDNGTETQYSPAIAVEGADIHVAWTDEGDGDMDIYYRHFDGVSWQPEIPISNDAGSEDQYRPMIAADGGQAHVVWSDKEEGTSDIYYRNFNGITWQPEKELGHDSWGESQGFSSMAAENGKVHVVWTNTLGFSDSDIYYRCFNGTEWAPEQDLTPEPGPRKDQKFPSIAVSGDEIHVVWEHGTSFDIDIHYRHFDGSDWQPNEDISPDGMDDDQAMPWIDISGDKVHVVWEDDRDGNSDIYYRHFDGSDWQPHEVISSDTSAEPQLFPSIALSDDKVHVVWQDGGDGDFDIHYAHSTDVGWWSEKKLTTDNGTEHQYNPSIAVDGDNVHVVWADHGDGDGDIFYRGFNGVDWLPEYEISTDTGTELQGFPTLAVDGNEVHVVWEDQGDGDSDIYYRHFDGLNWLPEQEVSTDTTLERQAMPSVALDGGQIYVVWMDEGDGDADIYYRQRDGLNWLPEMEISADSGSEVQYSPAVATGSGKVHIVWEDFADGDMDIYYRQHDGLNWLPESEVSVDDFSEMQVEPSLAVEGEKIHVVWKEYYGDMDIYYRQFDGEKWKWEQEISIDEGTEYQSHPSIAVKDNRPHVVWEDFGGEDWDIFYRSGVEDLVQPTSMARQMWPWMPYQDFNITWSATDNAGVSNVSLYYRYSSDNSTWLDWEEWLDQNMSPRNSTGGRFHFTSPQDDGFYEFYTIAMDTSWNIESPPATPDARTCVDTKWPTGYVLINNGATITSSEDVTLTLGYSDETSGVYLVRYSNDGEWDNETWESPSRTKEWILEGENSTRRVYFQIRDHAGWVSPTYYAEIEVVSVSVLDIITAFVWWVLVPATIGLLIVFVIFLASKRRAARQAEVTEPIDEGTLPPDNDVDSHVEEGSLEEDETEL
jgi:Fe-S cluster biogenesis protein NfuA